MISERIFGVVRFTATVAALLLCSPAIARAQDPALTIVHTFVDPDGGLHPEAGLIQASDDYLYGTTTEGGSVGRGTVFRMSPEGAVTTLHSFTGPPDGAAPLAGLTQASDGNLYGTTVQGGAYERGTLYRMTPAGAVTILHSFTVDELGGEFIGPQTELIQARDGHLYGTTPKGNSTYGTIFRLTLTGEFTRVHSFPGFPLGGSMPNERLVEGFDGHLYGTTQRGGATDGGTAFRLSLDGVVTILHSFSGRSGYPTPCPECPPCLQCPPIPPGPRAPNTPIIQAIDGNFYGTSGGGGDFNGATFYRMTPDGEVTILSTFPDSHAPAALMQASDLNFYGTRSSGIDGTNVFRLDYAGNYTRLGWWRSNEASSLVHARSGALYGTSWAPGGGFVFRLSRLETCDDALSVSYTAGTLNLGFTLMTTTPAAWRAWLALPGPPVQAFQLWSVPIPAVLPAVFVNLPVPGFPDIGKFFVLTALSTESGAVCADWKVVDTGAAAAAPSE